MAKKVTLEIPDEIYKSLSSLCIFYNQGIKQMICGILKAISEGHRWLTVLSEQFGSLSDIGMTLHDIIFTSFLLIDWINYIPDKLGVKRGEFALEDFDFSLEDSYFMFDYAAKSNAKYDIDSFNVTKETGQVSLSIETGFYVNKVSQEALNKLKQLIKDYEFDSLEGFEDVDSVNVEIDEFEEIWILRINCWAETLEELPTIKQVSRVIKRACKEAGINVRK
ncbi:MAG: hypothetical protein QXS74_08275 [Nitrososphaeria archaeon]